jgi:hypothetical protein
VRIHEKRQQSPVIDSLRLITKGDKVHSFGGGLLVIMNITQTLGGQSTATFTCQNDFGETTTELDTPFAIRREVMRNIACRRNAGVVYSDGARWQWWNGRPTDIVIEITRDGEVEEVCPVPLPGWLALQLSAARRGLSTQDLLIQILASLMEDGDTSVRDAIEWVFPRKPSDDMCLDSIWLEETRALEDL